MKRLVLLIISLCFSFGSQAQLLALGSSGGIDTLSLKDLMDIKITVASAKELTPRESPGIVSFISSTEIRESGARDLMEILQVVPGFEFGSDVEGVVGLGVRGNWAHEGKVVLLIDGIEMNESLYSTLQFGNHYPTENIERIEIIRGPGSAMYGGYAAYAVINVITRKPINNSETSVSSSASTGKKGMSRAGIQFYTGHKKNKFKSSINVAANQGERSQSKYTDVYGNSYSMHNNSDLNNLFLNGNISYGKTQLQLIADNYHTTNRDEYITALTQKYHVDFTSYLTKLSHDFKVGKKWQIIPKIEFRYQQPWKSNMVEGSADSSPFNISTRRIRGEINTTGQLSKNFTIVAGLNSNYLLYKGPVQKQKYYCIETKKSLYFEIHLQ